MNMKQLGPALAQIFAVFVLGLLSTSPTLAADGRDIALHGTSSGVPACSTCHGINGEGQTAAGFPRLAGLTAVYMVRQLASFADDTRSSPIMGPFARGLSSADQKATADYYAGLSITAAKTNDSAGTSEIAAGALLAERGAWSRGVPGCGQCHGPLGTGAGDVFPRLAGQSALYIANQLNAWRAGTRHNDPMGLMAAIRWA